MTDKPTPKEIGDLVYELRQEGKDDTYSLASAVLAKWGQPSGATEEVENLRKALVYAAFALHDTPQYMLAQGMTLIDGDTVRVSRDGWTVEASVNPHRQPARATQQAGEVRRAELVPGVMHCAKCKFQLNRVTLCVSDGNAYAGNNKTEPCPNGCGPLWPVTWEQEAKNCWKALEEMHERLMAAFSLALYTPRRQTACQQFPISRHCPSQTYVTLEQSPKKLRSF